MVLLFPACSHRLYKLVQNQSRAVIVIRALVDAVLEGDEHFSIRLFPAESGAVIDPLNGECGSYCKL